MTLNQRSEKFIKPLLIKDDRSKLLKDCNLIQDQITKEFFHYYSPGRVLYVHTDCSGVVYHANYLIFFEIGRNEIMRNVGNTYSKVEEGGTFYPVVESHLTYQSPLRYDDHYFILTRPSALERTRIRFDYIIVKDLFRLNAGAGEGDEENKIKIMCRGYTIHCSVNKEFRPSPVDQTLIDIYNNFPK